MIRILSKINGFLTSSTMKYIDYIGAFFILGYSGYKYYTHQDYLLILSFGLVALVFAIFQPAKMIANKTTFGNEENKGEGIEHLLEQNSQEENTDKNVK